MPAAAPPVEETAKEEDDDVLVCKEPKTPELSDDEWTEVKRKQEKARKEKDEQVNYLWSWINVTLNWIISGY